MAGWCSVTEIATTPRAIECIWAFATLPGCVKAMRRTPVSWHITPKTWSRHPVGTLLGTYPFILANWLLKCGLGSRSNDVICDEDTCPVDEDIDQATKI